MADTTSPAPGSPEALDRALQRYKSAVQQSTTTGLIGQTGIEGLAQRINNLAAAHSRINARLRELHEQAEAARVNGHPIPEEIGKILEANPLRRQTTPEERREHAERVRAQFDAIRRELLERGVAFTQNGDGRGSVATMRLAGGQIEFYMSPGPLESYIAFTPTGGLPRQEFQPANGSGRTGFDGEGATAMQQAMDHMVARSLTLAKPLPPPP